MIGNVNPLLRFSIYAIDYIINLDVLEVRTDTEFPRRSAPGKQRRTFADPVLGWIALLAYTIAVVLWSPRCEAGRRIAIGEAPLLRRAVMVRRRAGKHLQDAVGRNIIRRAARCGAASQIWLFE